MNWDDLIFLLAVARKRTLSGAAVQLGVTHTTVGRRIKAAEDRLGVRLFDRTPEGWMLTSAGLDLAETAERVESEVLSAEARIMGRDADLRGGLRVSMLDFLFWGLHSAFHSFIHRYPSVELTITATSDPVSLTRREADVAVRLTESPPEHLIGRKLCDVHFAAYASESLVEEVGLDNGLGGLPWLGLDERLDSRWLTAWLAEHAPGARIAVRIDEGAILRRQAVIAGMGAFFMPCFEAESIGGLRRLTSATITQSLWLLTLSDLRHTSRVRAFMDHMAELPLGLGEAR